MEGFGLTELHLKDPASQNAVCGVEVAFRLDHAVASDPHDCTCGECFRSAYLSRWAVAQQHRGLELVQADAQA